MYLRLAEPNDFPFLAEVAAQAMLDDELFAFLCPRRREFYSDYRESLLRRLRTKWTSPGWVFIVAVDETEDETVAPTVVGYAAWERLGEAAQHDCGEELAWWTALQRTCWNLYDGFTERWLSPDRSVDESRLASYNASTTECFPWTDFPHLWWLSTLAVHPSHQRRGIGRMLVQWGMDHAHRGGFPVGLEASVKGTGLYETLGFQTVNELQLVHGVQIKAMLWNSPTTAGCQPP